MAKFYGAIGYAEMVKGKPGVHKEKITERMYHGDLIRNTRKLQTADQLNDNINVANEISIVSDPFANENFIRCDTLSLWVLNGRLPMSKFNTQD